MNEERVNRKTRRDIKLEENVLQLSGNNSQKENFAEVRDQRKKETLAMKAKLEKMTPGCSATFDQCFSGGTFQSQYEEECPVNYSLKYSETESCKAVKAGPSKEKFKDFADYVETDLDQPTNFSLKYAENNCDEETKNPLIIYYPQSKRKFKQYADYAETDLDQPTDFTLKYRESVEEEIKNPEFHFYENSKEESSGCYGSLVDPEEPPNDPVAEPYAVPDETPLMFSRCSSLNSLSSFVHITQSIPDDRSSVISDFSRMTSGIISPSELPDSPTQTAPSSPKRIKAPGGFPTKADFSLKKSVFEDDVATYKQEDTPVEFSRATSLSSLNIDNSVKSECAFKGSAVPPLVCSKDEGSHNTGEQLCTDLLKNHVFSQKPEFCKEKFELASVREVDENLHVDRMAARIQKIGPKSENVSYLLSKKKKNIPDAVVLEINKHGHQNSDFALKHNIRHKLAREAEKVYSAFEVADDVVHTYYTEGTPANISHAGSHSDLSNLMVATGVPSNGVPHLSDSSHFCSGVTQNRLPNKLKLNKDKIFNEENLELNNRKSLPPAGKRMINSMPGEDVYLNSQSQFDYLRKDLRITPKDETATFITENSPCDFSVRSSFDDLTVNVENSPICLNRSEICEEPPSQILTPLHNVSPQSPNSINLGEAEDLEKDSEPLKICDIKNNYWMEKSHQRVTGRENVALSKNYLEGNNAYRKPESPSSRTTRFDFYSSEPLTPFEEALLEQCIRLGMPQTKNEVNVEDKDTKSLDNAKSSVESEHDYSVPEPASFKKNCYNSEEPLLDESTSPCAEINVKTENFSSSEVENFDFDSAEPLTLFEEALLEQCIRLGMSQKETPKKSAFGNGGRENISQKQSENVSILEAALLEQCIRSGMPRKKTNKKFDENHAPSSDAYNQSEKIISCAGAQLNKLRINSDPEKDKENSGKNELLDCNCGKKHNRKKNTGCRKSKKWKN